MFWIGPDCLIPLAGMAELKVVRTDFKYRVFKKENGFVRLILEEEEVGL